MEQLTRSDLMTTREAADQLRIPVATLRHWRRAGRGPRSVKVGRERLYVRADVDGFYANELAQQSRTA